MSDDVGTRDDESADGESVAGVDASPGSARTEAFGRQATATRPTSTGPVTRVPATPRSNGPATSGPTTAVRESMWSSSGAAGSTGLSGVTPRSAEVDGVGAESIPSAIPSAELGTTVVTAVPRAGAGAVRKARLTVSQLDPWSVMKMSFLLSLAGGIVLVVAVWLLWLLLADGDVFVSIDRTVGDIAGSGSTISVVELFSLRRVMGVALMLAVVQVVLVTALATLAAFLYNLAAGLVGGFEVTLSEDA